MAYDAHMPQIDVEQSLDNLKLERDAIVLYDALAQIEKNPHRADAFRRIASNERRHADVWASRLRELGATVVRDVTEVGEYGWLSVILDPAGATIAMWKPRQDSAG